MTFSLRHEDSMDNHIHIINTVLHQCMSNNYFETASLVSIQVVICMYPYRIKSTLEQHRTVTDTNGILGRCVTELMWCVRQQDIECSRVYNSDLTPDELSRRGKVQ